MDGGETLVGLLATVVGGGAYKIFDTLMARRKEAMVELNEERDDAIEEAANIRQELRGDIDRLRQELASLKVELDDWRNKYYELREQNAEILAENARILNENSLLLVRIQSMTMHKLSEMTDGTAGDA